MSGTREGRILKTYGSTPNTIYKNNGFKEFITTVQETPAGIMSLYYKDGMQERWDAEIQRRIICHLCAVLAEVVKKKKMKLYKTEIISKLKKLLKLLLKEIYFFLDLI